MEHITLIVFLHTTADYENEQTPLECSVKIGCEVTLARRERLSSVSIDDERYTVQVVSDGSNIPARIIITPDRTILPNQKTKLRILTENSHTYDVLIAPITANVSRMLTFTAPKPHECIFINMSAPLPKQCRPDVERQGL
jgi:hypothetical protein